MSAIDGFGVVIGRDDGGGGFTKVAQLMDVGGPSLQKDAIDVTTKDSTSKYREFIPGLRDPGELTFSLTFDPAATTHVQLTTDYDSDVAIAYELSFGDVGDTTWEFSGIITQIEPTGPMDGQLTADVTIKLTGVCNFSP